MSKVSLKLLGTGDAFHTGGRLHTSFALRCDGYHALIDCGATTLAFMRHLEVDVPGIDAILLSHLHGDHFGGIPFILMDACYNARRTKPLTIAGPQGTRLRLTDTRADMPLRAGMSVVVDVDTEHHREIPGFIRSAAAWVGVE